MLCSSDLLCSDTMDYQLLAENVKSKGTPVDRAGNNEVMAAKVESRRNALRLRLRLS